MISRGLGFSNGHTQARGDDSVLSAGQTTINRRKTFLLQNAHNNNVQLCLVALNLHLRLVFFSNLYIIVSSRCWNKPTVLFSAQPIKISIIYCVISQANFSIWFINAYLKEKC